MTPSPAPPCPRCRGPLALADRGETVVDGVQGLGADIGDDDDVLDAGAPPPGHVDAGLDREGVAGHERLTVAADEVRVLVLLEPDAVPGSVDEIGSVAALVDEAAGDAVDVLAWRSRHGGAHGLGLGL